VTEADGPLVNGRESLTPHDVQRWCRDARAPVLGDAAASEIAAALNYAALFRACWHPAAEPLRRSGPSWAPRLARGRGRPHRLENNLATNIRRLAGRLWAAEQPNVKIRPASSDVFTQYAFRWVMAQGDSAHAKSPEAISRAARRRHAARE
jgi:hypothetical protein